MQCALSIVQSPGKTQLRACSHESGTVNYPGVMIAPGQELPRVHMMIRCPGATLPQVNFIAPGQVHRHPITTNVSEFLYFFTQIITENDFYTRLCISGAFWNFLLRNLFQTLIMSMRKTTLAPGQLLSSVHMEKSYLGKAGYPVLYNG